MFNKKAGVETPFVFFSSLQPIIILTIFAIIYFYVLGGAYAPEVVISAEEAHYSHKLIDILNTPVNAINPNNTAYADKTFYDIIQDTASSKNPGLIYQNLTDLALLLKKITPPAKTKQYPSWVITAFNQDLTTIKHIDVSSNGIVQPELVNPKREITDQDHFIETLVIPIKDSEPIILQLKLSCTNCDEEYLGGLI